MNNTIVITSIYNEFWGTDEFKKSVDDVGLPLHNAFTDTHFKGNAHVIRSIYKALVELKDKYKYAIYADGADSYFLKSFTPPDGVIVYSTEKAMYPPMPVLDYPPAKTRWCYLNGGGYCGEITLLIEYFEKYGLDKIEGNINGQLEQAQAFLQAVKDGFPITLDQNCEYFQTVAFQEPDDFSLEELGIRNNRTSSHPCLIHGNGRTDMKWIYNMTKPWQHKGSLR